MTTTLRVQLSKGEIIRLPKAQGVQLRCVRGLLWITQTADYRDHFLSIGQSYVCTGTGLVLVEAQEEATVVLTTANCAARACGGLVRWIRPSSGLLVG